MSTVFLLHDEFQRAVGSRRLLDNPHDFCCAAKSYTYDNLFGNFFLNPQNFLLAD